MTPEKDKKIKSLCHGAAMVLGFSHPHFLLIHARIRNKYLIVDGDHDIDTMAVTDRGALIVNADFAEKLTPAELRGVLAHEMLHLVLQHIGRAPQSARPKLWNIAADMAINHALLQDGFTLPEDVCKVPAEYTGDIYTESIYHWLLANPPPDSDSLGRPKVGQGCGVDRDKGESGTQESDAEAESAWKNVAVAARAMAQASKVGGGGIGRLLAPRTPRIDWRKVLRHGTRVAASKISRDYQTLAKRNRRSPTEGVQLPGWQGNEPRVALVIDVSGSMDAKWVELCVSEARSLLKMAPGMKVFLVTHTSDVCWQGWIDGTTQTKLQDAVQFSGGTDPNPAYEAVRHAGSFDVLVHFTDTQFFGTWPVVPAKKLIVGCFGTVSTQPPVGSEVILCE